MQLLNEKKYKTTNYKGLLIDIEFATDIYGSFFDWQVKNDNDEILLSGRIFYDWRITRVHSDRKVARTKAQVLELIKERIFDASNRGKIPKVNMR